nr:hypothetical protein [Tanacetum cinerariifolium]
MTLLSQLEVLVTEKPKRLLVHVGDIHSPHNKARRACEDLMNLEQHIGVSFFKQDPEVLLHQGLAFRGHDETKESNNQGNFKVLLKFLADQYEGIRKVVLDATMHQNEKRVVERLLGHLHRERCI